MSIVAEPTVITLSVADAAQALADLHGDHYRYVPGEGWQHRVWGLKADEWVPINPGDETQRILPAVAFALLPEAAAAGRAVLTAAAPRMIGGVS